MTPELPIYNIPIDLFESYRGRRVIVRVDEPARLPEKLKGADIEKLCFIQILDLNSDVSALATWGIGVPVDLIIREPKTDFVQIYNLAKLLEKRPGRVTVPVQAEFVKAVRIAGALGFAIKLCVVQPDTRELTQLFEVLDMFLHQPEFSQRVEFFQSSMQSFYLNNANSLWEIQEEDPAVYRYVSNDGKECPPPRGSVPSPFTDEGFASSVEGFLLELLRERRECLRCEFVNHCRGYFKWPNKDYLCSEGVKELFHELEHASEELREDLATYNVHRSGIYP